MFLVLMAFCVGAPAQLVLARGKGKVKNLATRTFNANTKVLSDREWKDVLVDVKDSCVQIVAYGTPFNFELPFRKADVQADAGSGFFIEVEKRLCVVTNYHVVDQSCSIYLQHAGAWQEKIELELLGACPEFDIALLGFKTGQQAFLEGKLAGKKIVPLVLGDSDKISIGDEIMVLGYPLAQPHLKQSIGRVSGQEPTSFGECFTTTAAVAPGSSGGPCLNKKGEVVALTVAMVKDSQGYNFLLPISREKVVLDQLKDGVILPNFSFGAQFVSTTPDMAAYLNAPVEGGVLVVAVTPGGTCDKAGIIKGDLITGLVYEDYRMAVDRFGYASVPWTTSRMGLRDIFARVQYGTIVNVELYRDGQLNLIPIQKTVAVSTTGIANKHIPFENAPEYEVFAGCVITEVTQNLSLEWLSQLCKQCKGKSLNRDAGSAFSKISEPLLQENEWQGVVISYILPTSVFGTSKVFEQGPCYIKTVNNIPVSTIPEYRQALLKSRETGYIVLEAMNGVIGVVKLATALEQEPQMAEMYGYPLSESYHALSVGVAA
jgi:S1-C subfamily serine protease